MSFLNLHSKFIYFVIVMEPNFDDKSPSFMAYFVNSLRLACRYHQLVLALLVGLGYIGMDC